MTHATDTAPAPLSSSRDTRGALLRQVAAPRWTVTFFLATAVAALLVGQGGLPPTPLMLLPFALLVANLLAAIVTNGRFRADVPLLVFHLALLALVALFAFARLTYLDAKATLSRGQFFEGRTEAKEQGPLHWGELSRLSFANDGLTARYDENGTYRGTYNRVRWQGADGRWRHTEIGDDRPLLLNGYRIYATVHRGLAPLFHWRPQNGPEELGAVQLADHRRVGELPPALAWTLPGGPDVWLQLNFDPLPAPKGGTQDNLGAQSLDHSLVLRSGERREVIRIGDSVDFPEGRLSYLRLDSWMSYRIVYDPTIPWTIAVLLIGIGSLCWYYVAHFRRTPIGEDGA